MLLLPCLPALGQSGFSVGLRGSAAHWFGNDYFSRYGKDVTVGQSLFARLERRSGWAFELGAHHGFQEGRWVHNNVRYSHGSDFQRLARRSTRYVSASLGVQHRVFALGKRMKGQPAFQQFAGVVMAIGSSYVNIATHQVFEGRYSYYEEKYISYIQLMPGLTATSVYNTGRHLQASLEISYQMDLNSLQNDFRNPGIDQRIGIALGLGYRF